MHINAAAGFRSLSRAFRAGAAARAKVLAVLYPDPLEGFPPPYARSSIPTVTRYPDGSTPPTPRGLDYTPGELLGCVSGELGLRPFLEAAGHTLVVTSDKDGDGCRFERELADAEYVISQPFYPAYMTRSRIEKAPLLKACITAGIGSDHVDLEAAVERKVDVAECTFSNSIGVAEHVVLSVSGGLAMQQPAAATLRRPVPPHLAPLSGAAQMLALVRNFPFAHEVARSGGWHIADISQRAYDIEGMQVGSVAAGRIGVAMMRRLKPFDVGLHYTDRHRLPAHVEAELGATFWPSWEEMAPHVDILALNCPLHAETEHMINARSLQLLKRGSFLINTARGERASDARTRRLGWCAC